MKGATCFLGHLQMKTKECFRCHQVKPLSEFYKSTTSLDGHRGVCKKCDCADARESYDYTPRWKRLLEARTLIPQGLNRCAECNEIKPLTEFFRRPEFATGYPPRCKECDRKRTHQERTDRRERFVNIEPPATKQCGRCHEIKPSDEFSADTSTSDKLAWHCKACQLEMARIMRRRQYVKELPNMETKICEHCHQEKPISDFRLNPHKREYCRWCLECESQNGRLKTLTRKEQNKLAYRKTKYGILYGEYQELLKSQNYVCAICGKPETRGTRWGTVRSLAVDHDHGTSQKVRGLLCDNCNNGIGRFHDDPELLRKAALYLEKYQVPS